MTEQQINEVLVTRGDVELRKYADCVVADVVVTGSAEQAGNRAFRPLVSYIGGSNQSAASLAMTAPVIQQASGEKLAMMAPVIQEALDADRWTSGNVARRTEELRQAMADAGWASAGPWRWARFDPPWTPAFARRNEIVIPVQLP